MILCSICLCITQVCGIHNGCCQSDSKSTAYWHTGGIFGLYVALTGERMPGGAVAMAEGNALGKGPVIFHLFDSGIELIRRKAAGQAPASHPTPARIVCSPPAVFNQDAGKLIAKALL